ncbi:MAG: hypothetical protein ACLP1X_33860 [Polyangiaceae bacterium]
MTMRFVGAASLVLFLLACSSTPSTGGFGGEGSDQSSGGGNSSNGAATSSSGAGASSSGGSVAGGSSSSGASGSSGGGSGSSSGTGGSSSGASSSGASSSGSGLTTGDAGLQNNPDIDYTVAPVTLTMSTFTVQPGAEVYYCQNFANPWGKQVDIKTYSLDMGVGSHHMFAFYASDATNGALAACPNGGNTFGAFTFVSQTPKATVTYPQSVGATIPSGTGFQMMVHYLNTTSSTLTSSVALTMWVAKPNVVTNHAGVLFLNQATMTVAATCTTGCPSTGTYQLPQDVYILQAAGHMHKFATNFVATTSTGVTLYTNTQWSEPEPENYSPPLMLASGTTITWTCTDVNTTGEELTFGESAETNVMCISQNVFYPVSDVDNPVLGDLTGFTF